MDRAWELYDEHRVEAVEVVFARFDELHPEPPPELAVRRLDGQARLTAIRNDGGPAAEALFRQTATAHRALGHDAQALAAESRAVLSRQADEDMIAELGELTERIVAHPDADADMRAEARLRAEGALLRLDRPEDALAAVDAAAAEEPTRATLRAELASRRSRGLLVLERYDEAVAAAEDSLRQYAALGTPPAAGIPALIRAHALGNLERFDDAAAGFDQALALASDRNYRLSALVGRARTRLAADRPADAIDDLVEAVADHVAHGEDAPAALLRYDLATAYYQADQPTDAAEAAESALDGLDRAGAQEQADQTRYLLSRIYRELGELDLALGLLETLAKNLDGFDNLPARGRMLQEAAQLLYEADRDAQAADRFAAAAEAYRAAQGAPTPTPTPGPTSTSALAEPDRALIQAEMYTRRMRALSLRWAGDSTAALSALADADALSRSLSAPTDSGSGFGPGSGSGSGSGSGFESGSGPVEPEPWVIWQRAMLDCDAARVLIGADHLDDAATRSARGAEALRAIGSLSDALDADFLHAETLMRAGNPAAAETRLRSVLGAVPRGSQLEANSAWMLAESLEAQGRSEEADQIRSQYLSQ
jgi:tetratricopeptide (TPR) repeat protein